MLPNPGIAMTPTHRAFPTPVADSERATQTRATLVPNTMGFPPAAPKESPLFVRPGSGGTLGGHFDGGGQLAWTFHQYA